MMCDAIIVHMMCFSFQLSSAPPALNLVTSFHSREQGEILAPGDVVQIIERFTPLREVGGVVYFKLADGRGWIPARVGV